MQACISQACVMPTSWEDDVAAAKAAGVPAVEVWLTKLETYLKTHTLAEARTVVEGLTLTTAAYQGGLLTATGEAEAVHRAHFTDRLKLCDALNIRTMLIVSDPGAAADIPRAAAGLAQAAHLAAGLNITLAFEFRAGGIVSCCDTAVSLVEAIDLPNLGIALDLFHFMKGPSKTEDLARLTASNLKAVHLCDIADTPRELMSDAERILPGEGDLPVELVISRLKQIGYAGPISVEMFNPILWKSKPTQVYELAWQALQRALG